jgi:hypothetical protein
LLMCSRRALVQRGGEGEEEGAKWEARGREGGRREAAKREAIYIFSQRTCCQLPNGCFGARKSIGPRPGAKLVSIEHRRANRMQVNSLVPL